MRDVWESAIEERFQKKMQVEVREAYTRATLLAAVLYPAFSVLDWLTQQEHFFVLSLIRLSMTLLFVLIHWAARKKIYPGGPLASGVFILMLATAGITAMCIALDGYRSPYYAGVSLIMLTGVVLFPWGAKEMAVAASAMLSVYILGVLTDTGFSIDQPALLINNLGFLFAIAIVGISSAQLSDRLRRQAFANLIEVEKAREHLARYDQIKTRFFANVSHELRTPLTLILGSSERLLSTEASEKNDELRVRLELVQRNARALLKHVNDLLDVAKIEAGKMSISYSEFDLARMIRTLSSNFDPLASEKQIDFTVRTPESLFVQADPEKIERVVMNLLSNAFKFTPEGGSVRCLLEAENSAGERFRIRVSDSGPGIPIQMRQAVFERFFQVEESHRRQHGGTGLGLAIVQEFVTLHDGTIEVGDAPGGGAVFSVLIPVKAPSSTALNTWTPREKDETTALYANEIGLRTAKPSLANNSSPETEEISDLNQPLILVIEDHPEMREFIASALKGRFRVETAPDGRRGFEFIRELRPDLVLSDIMMPEVSGVDLLQMIRSDASLDSTPVVILTAKSDDELRVRLLREGAQDYLIKPFSVEELVARISNLVSIKRSKEILGDELQSREIELEAMARQTVLQKENLKRALEFAKTAQARAKSALKSRDEFILIASHELKTPLAAMKLHNDLAKSRVSKMELGQATDSDLKMIQSWIARSDGQLNRISYLINDMIDVSKIHAGKFSLELKPGELVSLVRQAIDRILPQLEAARIQVHFEATDSISGNWDGPRIEQVVTHLMSNVIKYAPGTLASVRVFRGGDTAVIQVQDQGMGIEKEHLKRIFDRFERATSPTGVSGLGLGLYISRQIVQAHGGRIRVESELGKGSTFWVELPLAVAHSEFRSSLG